MSHGRIATNLHNAPHQSTFLLMISLLACVHVTSANPVLRSDDGHNGITRRLSTAQEDENKTVPFNSWDNTIDTLQYGLAFVVVLVAAHPLGLFFPKLFKLPLITGYLVIGIIAGPFVSNLITKDIVTMLSNYVSALALSFISFQAGQEIYWPELRPQLKSIMVLLGMLYVTAMVILTSAILLAESAFFYDSLVFNCQLGIALMFGSISVLGSPATVMAIKIELNSVGPFTSLMLGATMTAEFVVLVSFSIARIVCSIYCAELDVSMSNLAFTMGIVLANILVGAILGGVTILIFKIPGGELHNGFDFDPGFGMTNPSTPIIERGSSGQMSSVESDQAPHLHNAHDDLTETTGSASCWTPNVALSVKGFIWLSMGYAFYISTSLLAEITAAAFGLSWEIKFEALLVLMIASCVAGHNTAIRHDMHVILDTVAPYMFLPFFVMTGASLKLDQVMAAVPLMTLYVVLRYVAIFIACYFGGRYLLKLTPKQYNNLWLTMTPQAGVALGLANEVQAMSDEPWAAEFAATIVAAVVVNQIIGPVLCAMGLSRAGETLKDRSVEPKIAVDGWDSTNKSIQSERLSSIHGGNFSSIRGCNFSNTGHYDVNRRTSSFMVTQGNGDPRPLLPFVKVQKAVVIGDDEVAFEVALELSLYGAHVNVPLLDEERTRKWQKMNATILKRATNLISYKNTLKDRDNAQAMSSSDVIIFTGDANRTRENVHLLKSLLGESHPRMIAIVPDCKFSKEMKEQGVLVIQPSIALANIATRMALLESKLAEALSNEISTTSDFSTASYFLRDDRDLSDMRFDGRRLALGRAVVNHHSVDYDRLAEVLAAENVPMPPPPSRVAMFGTSGSNYDPFSINRSSQSNFFVVHDDPEAGGSNFMTPGQSVYTPGLSSSARRSVFNNFHTPQHTDARPPRPEPSNANEQA